MVLALLSRAVANQINSSGAQVAHNTNVNQVKFEFPASKDQTQVTDPACGKTMLKKESRHVLFPVAEEPIYFCSRACLDTYQTSKHHAKAASF